jgi:chromosomal replication initiator protein
MHSTFDNIWPAAQEKLQSMLSPEIFNLWFAPLQLERIQDGNISLEVANDFCGVWLKENYLGLIQDVLMHVSGQSWKVSFSIKSPHDAAASKPDKATEIKPETSKPSVEKHAPAQDSVLNPNYTFDTFVVGSNNNFAHAAAMAVSQSPGKSYNPLFLYGGTGLGKTHLLQAIGHYVIQNRKNAKVIYLSSEKFTNEYIDAIQNSQLMRFRKKYRQTDVLLIDDIQFLVGKERIQEEFFHTFNALHEAHKQIVLTCDRPTSELQNLEARLISRFEWGLMTDLQPPDVETRMAILRKKAVLLRVTIPDEINHFLAEHIRSNIRRLEGALIRVTSYCSLTGQKPTQEVVENLLREMLHEEGQSVLTIDTIQRRVAEHYDIRVADMVSKRRPENIAFPRQVAMYLSRLLTGNSLNVIGEAFGGRDHGTVLHACRLVKDRMDIDPQIRQAVSYLEKQLLR